MNEGLGLLRNTETLFRDDSGEIWSRKEGMNQCFHSNDCLMDVEYVVVICGGKRNIRCIGMCVICGSKRAETESHNVCESSESEVKNEGGNYYDTCHKRLS